MVFRATRLVQRKAMAQSSHDSVGQSTGTAITHSIPPPSSLANASNLKQPPVLIVIQWVDGSWKLRKGECEDSSHDLVQWDHLNWLPLNGIGQRYRRNRAAEIGQPRNADRANRAAPTATATSATNSRSIAQLHSVIIHQLIRTELKLGNLPLIRGAANTEQ